jgi:urease accessory protein
MNTMTLVVGRTMNTDPLAALRLQSWLSPAFPVGAFSYSHGLEQAAEFGWVTDRDSLIAWLEADLRFGAGRNEAIFLAAAWRMVHANDDAALLETGKLSAAMRGSAELALESTASGAAFLRTIRLAWPHKRLDALAQGLKAEKIEPTLPIIFGATCAAHGVDLAQALPLYLHATAANLVSAALRLLQIGQTDGQLAIRALEQAAIDVANETMSATLDDLGSAALMVDMASLAHETQYTRLFRS